MLTTIITKLGVRVYTDECPYHHNTFSQMLIESLERFLKEGASAHRTHVLRKNRAVEADRVVPRGRRKAANVL